MPRIVCISDTHYGDILIHAGDATFNGKIGEVSRFMAWMDKLPHRLKIFIPGNHDGWFEHSDFPSDSVRIIRNEWYMFRMHGHTYSVLGASFVKELPLRAFNTTEDDLQRRLDRQIDQELDNVCECCYAE